MRFITVGQSIIDTGDKAWGTEYMPRTDKLVDVVLIVDGFVKSGLALGAADAGAARREISRQLMACAPGGLPTDGGGTLNQIAVDITSMGTGEVDAPNIIRPGGADLSLLKV
jgi:hypothetical protein